MKVNHAALSRSGTTHPETVEIEDSDTEPDRKLKDRLIDTPLGAEPPKLLGKVAATSSQQPQESTVKHAEVANPSLPSPSEALNPFPLSKQLQKPSPKSSDPATLSTKAPSATALTDFAACDPERHLGNVSYI